MQLASEKAIFSAHDASDGGIAVTLAESCFDSDGFSANVQLLPSAGGAADSVPAEYALFGERGARVVVSVSAASLDRVNAIAAQWSVATRKIGTVAKGDFRIEYNGNSAISGPLDSFRRVWAESLANATENK